MARKASRPFSDNEQTTFPKMGDETLTDHLVNVSGNRTPYTMPVAKKSTTTDQGPVGGKANRRPWLIHGGDGPACTPVATINYSNSPESSQTQRGMRTVPSKAGKGDFYRASGRDNAGRVI
jgi:hypothetical protein